MQLSVPNDSVPVKEMFERFFATESTTAHVRAAEPIGFDAALWRELVALDLPFLRVAADAGGSGMSLFDACIMMEEAGRRLASAPLAESVVVLRTGTRQPRLFTVARAKCCAAWWPSGASACREAVLKSS